MSKKITITLTVKEINKKKANEYGPELAAIEGLMEDLMSDDSDSTLNDILESYGYEIIDSEVKE